ncbi:MAG: thioredoxin-dependent thiol peroxidase [Acidimicrobiia bacterium]
MVVEAGEALPHFELNNHEGKPVSSDDLKGTSAILFFYPRAMTPGCTTESCDFRDNYALLQEAGYSVFGVSPDPPERNARFRDKEHLNFDLLSDEDHELAAALGAWGDKKGYGKVYKGLIRSTFEVGPDGTVERAWRNVRAKGHVARVIDELGL